MLPGGGCAARGAPPARRARAAAAAPPHHCRRRWAAGSRSRARCVASSRPGGPASIFLFTLAPDTLLGWTRPPPPDGAPLAPRALRRPFGAGATDRAGEYRQRRGGLGAPVRTWCSTLARDGAPMRPWPIASSNRRGFRTSSSTAACSAIPPSYTLPGISWASPREARELARYAERTLAEVDGRVARYRAERRPRVYYARGPRGLDTAAPGSINAESLDRLGVRNVAAEERPWRLDAVSLGAGPRLESRGDPHRRSGVSGGGAAASPRGEREGGERGAGVSGPRGSAPLDRLSALGDRLIGLRWLGRVLYPELSRGTCARRRAPSTRSSITGRPTSTQLDACSAARPSGSLNAAAAAATGLGALGSPAARSSVLMGIALSVGRSRLRPADLLAALW